MPFSKGFARVQVHANGSETFKFTKQRVTAPPAGDILTTETGQILTTETGARLITD